MFRKSKLSSASEERLRNLGAPESPSAEPAAEKSGAAASEERLIALGKQIHSSSHHSWKRRMLIVTSSVLAVVLVAGIGVVGYGVWRYSQINKLDLGGVLDGRSSGPMTILVVGSDTREDLDSGQRRQFGSGEAVGGQRSDTIMLLRVDPSTQRAAVLSIPRDTYVKIADSRRKDRINSAFDGGASNLISTIKQEFNIAIDHYAEVNFDTFRDIVNNIDGISIAFTTPVRDYDPSTGRNWSGLDIKRAGCVRLDGNQALSYVRSRHYQIYDQGRWRSDPLSDLGRVQRQQDFIKRVAAKAVDKGKSNPITLNSLISSSVKNITVDDDFSITDMTRLAKRFQSIDSGKIEMYTLPTTPKTVGGADVLVADSNASETVDHFLNGVPEPAETTAAPEATETPATTAPSRFVPATPSC